MNILYGYGWLFENLRHTFLAGRYLRVYNHVYNKYSKVFLGHANQLKSILFMKLLYFTFLTINNTNLNNLDDANSIFVWMFTFLI